MKKKIDESRIEYAALTINTDNIENRSEAVIDDGEYIRSHWQKNIIKHQPPIIRTMEDLGRLKIDEIT